MHPAFIRAVEAPIDQGHTWFIEGPVGAGKREAMNSRLRLLLQAQVTGYSILVLLPDRAARERYGEELSRFELEPFGAVELHTYYSLANRLVRLFWPLVAADAGFASPQRPPVFLNYEAAQYLMGELAAPLLAQGYFEGLVMRRQQIVSQLLDNLNKAAINGYSFAQAPQRLREAWVGEETRLRYYEQVQHCIELFRGHCLQHGLLDLSLMVEVFHSHLVEKPPFWRYFTERYRHLLADQVEEMVPVAHDLIERLLPGCASALLAGDTRGGLRVFMGVEAGGVTRLQAACQWVGRAPEEGNEDLRAFIAGVGRALGQEVETPAVGRAGKAVAGLIQERYRGQMIEQVAGEILRLVERGVAPGQIAVVAPHADGVLRFVLGEAFRDAEIPFAIFRRYESLREEPVARACLTLAALAHPDWGMKPPLFDVAEALGVALAPLDPLRATLLADPLYDPQEGALRPVEQLRPTDGERIGAEALERYERLRQWLAASQGAPLAFDRFLDRLFSEALSGPELQPEEAAIYSKLIASASGFRQTAPALGLAGKAAGHRYAEMILSGVVAAQYLSEPDLETAPESLVLVAPIYTYLLSGHTTRFQFWLDIGSIYWWEPPHQPLTNPHVLSRSWPAGEKWTDEADQQVRNQTLFRLVRGLALRCREGIYLCASELESSGEFQESPLLEAVQQVLEEGA